MRGIARLSDSFVGICCCHCPACCVGMTGIVISASPNVTADSIQVARLADVVMGACGHIGIIVTASPTVTANSIRVARLGDSVGAGCIVSGVIVTGSPKTTADG